MSYHIVGIAINIIGVLSAKNCEAQPSYSYFTDKKTDKVFKCLMSSLLHSHSKCYASYRFALGITIWLQAGEPCTKAWSFVC